LIDCKPEGQSNWEPWIINDASGPGDSAASSTGKNQLKPLITSQHGSAGKCGVESVQLLLETGVPANRIISNGSDKRSGSYFDNRWNNRGSQFVAFPGPAQPYASVPVGDHYSIIGIIEHSARIPNA
jgi:hypothetical protein